MDASVEKERERAFVFLKKKKGEGRGRVVEGKERKGKRLKLTIGWKRRDYDGISKMSGINTSPIPLLLHEQDRRSKHVFLDIGERFQGCLAAGRG